MNFMGVMLEKWPSKGQELLKYMHNVRLAASRMSGVGPSVEWKHTRATAPYPHLPKKNVGNAPYGGDIVHHIPTTLPHTQSPERERS
jgi:hypothetical protein